MKKKMVLLLSTALIVTSGFGVYANNNEPTCTTSDADYTLLQMLEDEKEYLNKTQYKELKSIYTQIEKLEKEDHFDEADKLWEEADAIYGTVEGFDLTEDQEIKLEELEAKLEKLESNFDYTKLDNTYESLDALFTKYESKLEASDPLKEVMSKSDYATLIALEEKLDATGESTKETELDAIYDEMDKLFETYESELKKLEDKGIKSILSEADFKIYKEIDAQILKLEDEKKYDEADALYKKLDALFEKYKDKWEEEDNLLKTIMSSDDYAKYQELMKDIEAFEDNNTLKEIDKIYEEMDALFK